MLPRPSGVAVIPPIYSAIPCLALVILGSMPTAEFSDRSRLSERVHRALSSVQDPELRRPLADLGMLSDVTVTDDGRVSVTVKLTVEGCPMKSRIADDVEAAARTVDGVSDVDVTLDVMSPQERAELVGSLKRTGSPLTKPDTLTRIIAVASGKGGVGKSAVTVNLAAALAAEGYKVGVIDADVLGFSVPGLMGVTDKPTRVDDLILPPVAHGVKVMSIGMFLDSNQPVMWRGPMLHRALEQFVNEVHFGDLDFLLLDLPPGTGDVAISVGQLLPHAGVLVVTTPQAAAAEVAERAGAMAHQVGQKVLGVVENMSFMRMPDGSVSHIFGSGGGELVAQHLSEQVGYPVAVRAQIPLEEKLRIGSDEGTPVVLSSESSEAADALRALARELASAPRGLAGKPLGVTPR